MRCARYLALGSFTFALAACGGRDAGGDLPTPTGDGVPGDADNRVPTDGVFGGIVDSASLQARIVRPNGNVSILDGTALTFEAEFSDGGIAVGPAVVWTSSIAGELGRVNPLPNVTLAAGVHVVTVTGTLGASSGSASVTVAVSDLAVRIISPDNGDRSRVGNSIDFRADARIVEGGNTIQLVSAVTGGGQRAASYAWSSNIDGAFGAANQVNPYAGLSAGEHVVTLTVTDDQAGGSGRSGSASINVVVRPPNVRPSVAITAPASCPVDLPVGEVLAMTGTITDPDAADVAIVGSWSDGAGSASGSGSSFSFSSTAPGKHAVVFTAVDSQGAADSAVCEVFVVPAGGRDALFPDVTAVNDALPGGSLDASWVGSDGEGRTLAGNDEGLVVLVGSGAALGTYDGGDLAVDAGPATIEDAAFSAGLASIATDKGLAVCAYTSGALSACVEAHNGDISNVDLSGDLVAAAVDGGLYLGRISGGAVADEHVFNDGNSDIPSNNVFDVLFVGGDLYVATNDGLCIVDDPGAALASDSEDLCSTILTEDNSVLPDSEVTALAQDGARVWIGTDDGVVLRDAASGAMVVPELPDGRVNDIAIDPAGIVWIATNEGVIRFDPVSRGVVRFDSRDWGNPDGSRTVSAILIDGNGDKWFATPDGLVRYTGL